MKPFLSIDLTTNRKNEQANGQEFIIAKPSLTSRKSLEQSMESSEQTIEKSKLPLPLRIGYWICSFVGIIIGYALLKIFIREDDITLAEIYHNAPWIFWVGGACLLGWGILKLIGSRKQKKVLETDESAKVFDNLDKTCNDILAELGVPSGAKQIDVLSFFYKVKDGKIKVCEKPMQMAPYLNPVFHIFKDSENLYLANLEQKYAIPLSSLKSIKSVKKTIRIIEWNKDEMYNEGIYKKYKMNIDNYGCIFCKPYHILEFEHNNELWGIYIPCYELPVIEKLTGLKAEEI